MKTENQELFLLAEYEKEMSTHDTGTPFHCGIRFSGDPYVDLQLADFDLHTCRITYRKRANKNGHMLTGEFNVSGRLSYSGGNTYPDLMNKLIQSLKEHREYVLSRQKEAISRKYLRWASRYPSDAAFGNVPRYFLRLA